MKSKVTMSKTLASALLFLMIGGLIFIPFQAMAQNVSQGDVAMELVKLLGFDVDSTDSAITTLTAEGIVPSGGWNTAAEATSTFIGSLYSVVNNTISQETLTPPSALGSASALVAAASTAAALAGVTTVEAVVAAGGDWSSASQGASYGTAVMPGPAPIPTVASPTPSGCSGGAAGGGGGGDTISQSS